MKKEDVVRLQVAHLHKKLHEAEKLRQQALIHINSIKDMCLSKEIVIDEYKQKLAQDVGEMSLPEWVQYYDDYIKTCEHHINTLTGTKSRMF